MNLQYGSKLALQPYPTALHVSCPVQALCALADRQQCSSVTINGRLQSNLAAQRSEHLHYKHWSLQLLQQTQRQLDELRRRVANALHGGVLASLQQRRQVIRGQPRSLALPPLAKGGLKGLRAPNTYQRLSTGSQQIN